MVRKKLNESNIYSVTLSFTIIGNLIFWPLTFLLTDFSLISYDGIVFFVLAELVAPGINRLLFFKGMESVGTSINSSIIATYPMYNAFLAVIFLNEIFFLKHWMGIIFVVVGVILIERKLNRSKVGYNRIFKSGLIFPIVGVFCFSFFSSSAKIWFRSE